jgi:hypothetical protein
VIFAAALSISRIVGRESGFGSPDVLLESLQLRSARDWNNPRLLRQQPGECDLSRGHVLPSCNLIEQLNQSLIRFSRHWRKARNDVRKSELSNVVFSSIFPVRNPLPRGLKGTNPIPRSSASRYLLPEESANEREDRQSGAPPKGARTAPLRKPSRSCDRSSQSRDRIPCSAVAAAARSPRNSHRSAATQESRCYRGRAGEAVRDTDQLRVRGPRV